MAYTSSNAMLSYNRCEPNRPNARLRTRTRFTQPFPLLLISLSAFCAAAIAQARPADDNAPSTPVLMELFTSEGCSSCPPADRYVEQADRSQPVPGIRIIVLSEHVDYWDHDGWKDPFSSAFFTERQEEYERALGLPTPYTPQIIVDGTSVLDGGAQRIREIYAKAAVEAKATVRINLITVDPAPADMVRAHIDVDGSPLKHGADVFFAIALDHAESQVLAGENSGRRLAYVAVVEELKKVGKLGKGKTFSEDVQLKLKSAPDPKNLRLIAFVQEPGPGKVLGAAVQKPSN
jgi:hypothetical protein